MIALEINYRLKEEDYVNFNMFHIKHSKTATRSLHMQRYLAPVFFIAISYVFSLLGDVPLFGLFITFLIMSILWIIFYPKYFYHFVKSRTKKFIREGKNDGLIGEHRMVMTEEGIKDFTTNGETSVRWPGIISFKEDNLYIYLFNTSVSAYILPKRDLSNEEEIRNYLISKLQHIIK